MEHEHIDGSGVLRHSHDGGNVSHMHFTSEEMEREIEMGWQEWILLGLAALGLLLLVWAVFYVLLAVFG